MDAGNSELPEFVEQQSRRSKHSQQGTVGNQLRPLCRKSKLEDRAPAKDHREPNESERRTDKWEAASIVSQRDAPLRVAWFTYFDGHTVAWWVVVHCHVNLIGIINPDFFIAYLVNARERSLSVVAQLKNPPFPRPLIPSFSSAESVTDVLLFVVAQFFCWRKAIT
jgi:hypothetical protein